jgi:RNA polymerase sigma factor (sigma-70 family)
MRTDDGSIVQECLNGKPGAFGILVDKYKAGIYAFVYTELQNFHDAEDVTQEVFLQAYRGLRNLRQWESFGFWLYRIARNLCKKWVRTQSRRPDNEFIEDQDPKMLEVSLSESRHESQMSESLQEALDSLPDAYREVLILYYFGGMNSKEIARAIGTSPGAIRMRLNRGRVQLREGMVAMMNTAFEGQRLQASFTFRIVEAVKRIKINPMPRVAGLPWGLPFAIGIFITVLSLNPHISLQNSMSIPAGASIPSESRVLRTGEIPVDILKTSEISVMSSKQGDGNGVPSQLSNSQKAFFLAPSAQGNTWIEKANMPTARCQLTTSTVNGKIYAIGGHDHTVYSTVEEYDPATNTWTKKADMLTARTILSASAANGKIYAIGGQDVGAVKLSIIEEYDPVADKWTRKADMPTRRSNLSTCAVSGKIYAIGGATEPMQHTPTVEEYDPATDTWTRKADMPTSRLGLSTCAVNGKIYAIGGAGPGLIHIPTVEEYDPATNTWTKKADMPAGRAHLCTSVVGGKIYAIGGMDGFLSRVEEFDPAADTWMKKANMPTERYGLSASVVKGKIYVIGGGNLAGNLSTVEEYDTGFVPKSVEPKGRLVTPWGEIKSD